MEPCPQCRAAFEPNRHQIYCSQACRWEAWFDRKAKAKLEARSHENSDQNSDQNNKREVKREVSGETGHE